LENAIDEEHDTLFRMELKSINRPASTPQDAKAAKVKCTFGFFREKIIKKDTMNAE
jgi:hypothetical protein